MSAYIHGSLVVTDPEAYEEYRRSVPMLVPGLGHRNPGEIPAASRDFQTTRPLP